MSAHWRRTRGRRAALVGDAGLLTAGSFGLFTGMALVVFRLGGLSPLGTSATDTKTLLLMLSVALLSSAGVFVGPASAWVLHGRHLDGRAIVAALAGYPIGAFVLVAFVTLLSLLASWVASLFTISEVAGPVAVLVLAVLGSVAVVVWLDVDALRDLGPKRRHHLTLDFARLAATIAVMVFGVVVLFLVRTGPENVAGVFMLAAGAYGSAMVAATAVVIRYLRKLGVRSGTHRSPHAPAPTTEEE